MLSGKLSEKLHITVISSALWNFTITGDIVVKAAAKQTCKGLLYQSRKLSELTMS